MIYAEIGSHSSSFNYYTKAGSWNILKLIYIQLDIPKLEILNNHWLVNWSNSEFQSIVSSIIEKKLECKNTRTAFFNTNIFNVNIFNTHTNTKKVQKIKFFINNCVKNRKICVIKTIPKMYTVYKGPDPLIKRRHLFFLDHGFAYYPVKTRLSCLLLMSIPDCCEAKKN